MDNANRLAQIIGTVAGLYARHNGNMCTHRIGLLSGASWLLRHITDSASAKRNAVGVQWYIGELTLTAGILAASLRIDERVQ